MTVYLTLFAHNYVSELEGRGWTLSCKVNLTGMSSTFSSPSKKLVLIDCQEFLLESFDWFILPWIVNETKCIKI